MKYNTKQVKREGKTLFSDKSFFPSLRPILSSKQPLRVITLRTHLYLKDFCSYKIVRFLYTMSCTAVFRDLNFDK